MSVLRQLKLAAFLGELARYRMKLISKAAFAELRRGRRTRSMEGLLAFYFAANARTLRTSSFRNGSNADSGTADGVEHFNGVSAFTVR
jgi:hypothetical protein